MREFIGTGELRGARFVDCDMTGATFRGVVLSNATITDGLLTNADISADITGLRLNGVEVAPLVDAELDRRHPERVHLRARDIDGLVAAFDAIDEMWLPTIERARHHPATVLHERVNGEYSFVETLRHLVFAVDTWINGWLREQPSPFSPLGVPPTDLSPEDWASIGLDADARPSSADATALFADRRALVRTAFAEVTVDQLDDTRTATPVAAWGEETHSVGECLRVVLEEHIEHRRFADRDLAVLAARGDVSGS
jgi:hypothetical protein